MTFELRGREIEFFQENGYLVVEKVVDRDEISWMRAAYDRIFEQRAGRGVGTILTWPAPTTKASRPNCHKY